MAEDADTLGLHRLVQATAHVLVEAAENFGAAIDQRRLDPEAVEDIGEFDGDIAAAGHHDRARQFLEVEGLVGRDAQLMARQRGMRIGRATDGDDDLLRRHHLAGLHQAHAVGSGDLRTGLEDLGAGILQPLAIETFEAGDFLVLGRNQRRPVEARLADRPAITGRILEMLVELRGIDEQLLRHAAADDAGAAEAIFLGDGHLLAERCRKTGAAYAAGAAADHEQVIVKIGHGKSPGKSKV